VPSIDVGVPHRTYLRWIKGFRADDVGLEFFLERLVARLILIGRKPWVPTSYSLRCAINTCLIINPGWDILFRLDVRIGTVVPPRWNVLRPREVVRRMGRGVGDDSAEENRLMTQVGPGTRSAS